MCTGFESNLTSCPANPVGVHDCVHEEDAGVQCARSGKLTACGCILRHPLDSAYDHGQIQGGGLFSIKLPRVSG